MDADLLRETVVSSAGATKHLPEIDGKRPSAVSVWRWMQKGVSTPTGRIFLESAVIGRKLVTSVEAVGRFTQAVAEARRAALAPEMQEHKPQFPRERSNAQRRRAIERAEREARQLGII